MTVSTRANYALDRSVKGAAGGTNLSFFVGGAREVVRSEAPDEGMGRFVFPRDADGGFLQTEDGGGGISEMKTGANDGRSSWD